MENKVLMEKTAKALEHNNIKCILANKKDDIIPILKTNYKKSTPKR